MLDAAVIGPALFAADMSRSVVAWTMRVHVSADPAAVTPVVRAVTRRPGARRATAAFVSGGLDPVGSRGEFLALVGPSLPTVLLVRPRPAPPRSAAEMEALALPGVWTAEVLGALAPHEENPEAAAAAILAAAGLPP